VPPLQKSKKKKGEVIGEDRKFHSIKNPERKLGVATAVEGMPVGPVENPREIPEKKKRVWKKKREDDFSAGGEEV